MIWDRLRRIWDRLRSFFGWILKIIRGDIVLADCHIDPDAMTYTTRLRIVPMSQATAYSMGYIRAYKFLDGWKWLPFRVYVRFIGAEPVPFPTETIDDDGSTYTVLETSSTLFDRYRTKSTEKFVKGMTRISITLGDQRKLILIAAVGLIAAAGMALIFLRRWNGTD